MASSMAKCLSGKTILITGASSGIGRACAEEFARTSPEALRLILTARRLDKLRSIADNINKTISDRVKIHCVQLDMTKPKEITSFLPNLPAEFQNVDVLLNNAGLVRGVAKAPEIDPDDIDVMFSTNVTGLIAMTQAILPVFKARGEAGAGDIINIGSIAARAGYPGGSIYCATKAAVRTFTEALRAELIETRIRVIEIDPGQVETEFSLVRFAGDKAKADAVYVGVEPLMGEDVAEIVVFAAGRPQNVVLADCLVLPNHQASATVMHRRP